MFQIFPTFCTSVLFLKKGDDLFNSSFFLEPSGDEYYSAKKHLFSPGGENKLFKPGTKRLSVRYRGWNISIIVCYDLRFPVWCRNRRNEYDLLIAMANWPVSRIDTWDTLLKARALENSAYVCGVNCRGIDDLGGDYNGSSHVFNYKGKDLAVNVSDDGLLYYRRIIDSCKDHLMRGGMLFFEIGCTQGEAVSRMMEQAGFLEPHIKKDYAGLDRVVFGTLGFEP